MEISKENSYVRQGPRPEIKISGQNTVLTYRSASFYDLHVIVRQINEIINNIAVGSEIFSIKRGITLHAIKAEGEDSGIILKFQIPKRINDMSLIGQAINASKSV